MGKLTLTVFLALCPAMGNAFVVRALGSTPVDSPRKRQASASLGAPLGIGRRLGADGALSRAGCNDGEDYAAWCSRRNSPLHGSKGVEPDGIEGGDATAPMFEGVGDVEVEDGVVAAVPRYEEDRSTVTAQELSSDEHLLKEQESVPAAHDSVTTQDGDAGARQDSGTHERQRTLEDRVNEALHSIVRDALSGRPASAMELDDDVNDALGSMVCQAFSGRPLSEVFWSFRTGEKQSGDAGGKQLREPRDSEVGTKSAGNDGSRLVASDDCIRAASEVDVDWSTAFNRNAEHQAAVVSKAGKERRPWFERVWGRVRRRGR